MKYKRFLIILIPLIITLLLWIEVKARAEISWSLDTIFRFGGQLAGLLAISLLAQSYVLATRFKFIENLFGGLDKSYKVHSLISKTGFVLILLHPMLIASSVASNFEGFIKFFTPQFNLSPLTYGSMSLALYTMLIVISIYRFLPYHIWKFTHQFIGVPFMLAGYHAFNIGSTFEASPFMRYWMTLVVATGVVAYLYKVILYRWFGPKHRFTVVDIKDFGDKVEIYLKPAKQKFVFKAGEFVFLSIRNNKEISKEQHPFTIASDPGKEYVKIAFKVLGDFTKKLKVELKTGDEVDVFGPYGHFNSENFAAYKNQIWISGGIGVTPFLSMLEFEAQKNSKKNIHFFYCNNVEKEAIHKDLISRLSKESKSVNFENYLAKEKGKITADYIVKQIKDEIKDRIILLCGPMPMMLALKKQFMKLGVSPKNIVFEEFNLV
ncbi:ferric reductase-like transmembrane domain-containing protein [Candidatus Dojkabacteria bacterium]|nr:ferric reductase-like transmembrane domain-containing protein [Candidatus Dojkabacteria bacterium]